MWYNKIIMQTYSEKLRDKIESRLELETDWYDKSYCGETPDDEKKRKMNEAYDRLIDILASFAVDGIRQDVFITKNIGS